LDATSCPDAIVGATFTAGYNGAGFRKEGLLACPFFMPTERFEAIAAPHRARLPLGDGWGGVCTAPGHENAQPDSACLSECCNLGYAKSCPRLPVERAWDAVRVSVAQDRGDSIQLLYVGEREHRPAGHGMLEFDTLQGSWRCPHPDRRIQRMAECYLEVYLSRRRSPEEASA
jgi:hypothetical protein